MFCSCIQSASEGVVVQAFLARKEEASLRFLKPTYWETWFVLVCGFVMGEGDTSVYVERSWWAAELVQWLRALSCLSGGPGARTSTSGKTPMHIKSVKNRNKKAFTARP